MSRETLYQYPPGRFGTRERHSVFPDADWKLIADGPVNIDVLPMSSTGLSQQVPGYFAVLAGAEHAAQERERP